VDFGVGAVAKEASQLTRPEGADAIKSI